MGKLSKLTVIVAAIVVCMAGNAAAADEWTQVSGGTYYSVALRSDGTLWAWGYNANGQLGDGTTTDRHLPIQVGTDTDWAFVSGGYSHVLAIKSDGRLFAWGYNNYGQLGIGNYSDTHLPVQVGSDTWVAVSGGWGHSLGIKSDGTLWAWGVNFWGQLGDGTTTPKVNLPVPIGANTNWSAVSASYYHSVAMRTDGTAWAWGNAASPYEGHGLLGDGTTLGKNYPVQVVDTDQQWVMVSAGYLHSLGLKADGSLWAWGENHWGQLGDGTTISRPSPVDIGSGYTWTTIQAKNDHSHAIQSDGTLWGWGKNTHGQLGDATNIDKRNPVQIGVDTTWFVLGREYYHSLALQADGTLWVWGRNDYGQLGDDTIISRNSPIQIMLATLSVTPAGGLVSSGGQGGPFSPFSQDYTLTNTAGSSLAWTASSQQSWTSLSPTGGTLAPGETATVTVAINANANILAPGSYDDSVIFANATTGNGSTTRSVGLTVIALKPDLIVSTLTGPADAVIAGQSISVSDATQNQGSAATTSETVTRFVWSGDDIYDASDTVLGSRTVSALAAGASSGPTSTSLTVPSGATPGTYYIIATADATGLVSEASEIDNTRYVSVTVTVPLGQADLIVSRLTSKTKTVTSGGNIAISETTANLGTAGAAASTTTFFWSTDPSYGGGDTQLGVRAIPELAVGATSGPVSTVLTLPSIATPGTYYIIAVADAGNLVTESSETNNTKYLTVRCRKITSGKKQ